MSIFFDKQNMFSTIRIRHFVLMPGIFWSALWSAVWDHNWVLVLNLRLLQFCNHRRLWRGLSILSHFRKIIRMVKWNDLVCLLCVGNILKKYGKLSFVNLWNKIRMNVICTLYPVLVKTYKYFNKVSTTTLGVSISVVAKNDYAVFVEISSKLSLFSKFFLISVNSYNIS